MATRSLFLSALAGLAVAQGPGTYSPLRPPAIPLAVRSPWMSTWLPVGTDVTDAAGSSAMPGNNGALYNAWPQFWSNDNVGWVGAISVDGQQALWMGDPLQWGSTTANQVAFEYTATQSIFTFSFNNVGLNVTFLSGVYPSDLMRAAFPNSYMEVEVWSMDGNSHDVTVYTDVTGEWLAGNRDQSMDWIYSSIAPSATGVSPAVIPPSGPETKPTRVAQSVVGTVTDAPIWTTSVLKRDEPQATHTAAPKLTPRQSPGGIVYHQFLLSNQQEYSNDGGTQGGAGGQQVPTGANIPNYGYSHGDWGNWYYSTLNSDGLTYMSSDQNTVRTQFVNNGVLTNTIDGNSGPIDGSYPVFAYAYNFGGVTTSQSTVFMISHHQQNCVQFQSENNLSQDVACLWTSYFNSDEDAISFFYNDYSTAVSMANQLDQQIYTDSVAAGGEQYAAITALATRQAFGALVWTNTPEQPWVFLEEISSDDNIQTIDVIFPFHPIAIYLNSTILKYMLEPHFINIAAGNWEPAYAPHDLGKVFPNATGYNGDLYTSQEAQPIEESGNFLIMLLAYAQRTGDTDFLNTYYPIFKGWTDYLIAGNNTIIPDNSAYDLSTDDFAGAAPNQTNLAIKGIIGIGAMAQLAQLVGNDTDQQYYSGIAQGYITEWIGFANDTQNEPPRMTFDYNDPGTWSLLYNIFGDAELNLGLVPQQVYDQQSTWYGQLLPQNPYGVLLDTRSDSESNQWSKIDWQMWCAATSSDDTSAGFVQAIFNWLNETQSFNAFPDLYNVQTGNTFVSPAFRNRPVVGGVFSKLALNSKPSTSFF